MKKGNITVEQLLHILGNESFCKQLLDPEDNCSFLGDSISKEECLERFEQLLHSSIFIMQKTKNFHYLPLAMKILNRFYLEKMKEDPFLFYENTACISLLKLLEKYPESFKEFKIFLDQIDFEMYQGEVGAYYQNHMKKNKILNDYETYDFLNYLMIYKNRKIPHSYVRYIFFILFEKKHDFEIKSIVYAELFRFLIFDLLDQLEWNGAVHIVSLKSEKKPFIFQGSDIYINLDLVKTTLEENLSYIPYLFDLIEKRYKYKSFVHNKYEEIKSKKQSTIKDILGSSFFTENYAYLSIESDITNYSLIDRLRFFEEIAPKLYQKMIEDYEKQILEALKNEEGSNYPTHLVLTLQDLLDQTILLAPEVIHNQAYLQMEYQEDGRRKKIAELLERYESELQGRDDIEHQKMAEYYAKTILTASLNISRLVEEFVAVVEYPIRFIQTEELLEKIFCEYFVGEINDSIHNHVLSYQELELILSKFNQYMMKFYKLKQKEISKYLAKDFDKWNFLNEHLTRLYCNVKYMSNPELYENTYLNLTQVLDIEDAKKIQKDVLKKKIRSQRIYMVILIVLILIFSVSLFLLVRISWQYWSANNSYEKVQAKYNQVKPVPILTPEEGRTEFPMNDDIPQVDFVPLKEENDEVIAWIRVDGTEINYPVVQGNDNEFYLSHLYNKKYNISGSIFGDYRNGISFDSDNLVLYGHNMRNGSMFGSLKKYKDPTYLETNKYIWLITPKATYQYEVFAAYEFDSLKDQYIFNFSSDESFQMYLDNVKQRTVLSSSLEVTTDDHILTLSTCTEDVSVKRFVVVAKRMVTYVALDKEV